MLGDPPIVVLDEGLQMVFEQTTRAEAFGAQFVFFAATSANEFIRHSRAFWADRLSIRCQARQKMFLVALWASSMDACGSLVAPSADMAFWPGGIEFHA